MKKNGFTLIELIAIMIILSLIILITYPIIQDAFNESKNSLSEEQINSIENIARIWAAKNSNELNEDEPRYLTIEELKRSGLVENKDILKVNSDEELTGCVKIYYENNKYNYEYEDSQNCNYDEKIESPELRLPSEYQEVEYIETTGKEYIYTGFNVTGNLIVEGKVYTEIQNTEMAIVGSVVSSAVEIGFSSINNRFFVYSKSSAAIVPTSSIYNTILEFTAKINTESPTKELILHNIDGGLTQSETSSNGSFQNTELHLFQYNNTKYRFIGRLYELKFYDNNVIARHFIPCYRKSDNVIGLYDLVNNVFYTNQGTGGFSKGSDV